MNANEFASKFTKKEKQFLRTIRECPRAVEMTIDAHAVGMGPSMQFARDCNLYGLYEASLYALNGVDSGHLTHGVGNELLADLRLILDKEAKRVARASTPRKPRNSTKYNLDDLV